RHTVESWPPENRTSAVSGLRDMPSFVIASEAKQSLPRSHEQAKWDCFAEFTLGLAEGKTRGLAMTEERDRTALHSSQFGAPPQSTMRPVGRDSLRISSISASLSSKSNREMFSVRRSSFEVRGMTMAPS